MNEAHAALGIFFERFVLMTLCALGFSMGVSAQPRGWGVLRKDGGAILRALAAPLAAVPLIALVVLRLFPGIAPPTGAAIAVMAVCPGAPFAIHNAVEISRDRAYTVVLQMAIVAGAVIAVPLWTAVYGAVLGRDFEGLAPREVFGVVGRLILLPMALGLAVSTLWERAAPRIAGISERIVHSMTVALGIFFVLVSWSSWTALTVGTVLLLAALACCFLAAGHVLGGRSSERRRPLALLTASRNPTLALALASANAASLADVRVRIVASLIVTVVLSSIYVRITATNEEEATGRPRHKTRGGEPESGTGSSAA